MKSTRLPDLPRTLVAVDTETWPIELGVLAPPLVCFSFAGPNREWVRGGDHADKLRGLAEFLDLLRDDRVVLALANAPFDLLVVATFARAATGEDVMPDVFAALAAGRVWDVLTCEMLRAVAEGTLTPPSDPFTLEPLRAPGASPEVARAAVEGARAWAGDLPERQGYAAQVEAAHARAGRSKSARHSLAQVLRILTGDESAKDNDAYRLRFRELDGIPWAEWPEVARLYVLDDARNTRRCALVQAGHEPGRRWARYPGRPGDDVELRRERHENTHDLANQVWTHWGLHLGSNRGFLTDQATVGEVEAAALAEQARDLPRFVEAGLVRADGTADQRAAARLVARAYAGDYAYPCPDCADGVTPCAHCGASGRVPGKRAGTTKRCPECDGAGRVACEPCRSTGYDLGRCPQVPRTETGGVSGSRDTLNESGDDLLVARAEFTEGKTLTLYVPLFRRPVVQPRANVIVSTGRISVGDGLHSLPRNGRVRECVVARPGYLLSATDIETAELVAHGQNLLWVVGTSELARALVEGVKPHNMLGAAMCGVSYDDFNALVKAKSQFHVDTRVAAKWGNFGFPGGSGAWKLVTMCRAQGPDTPAAGGPVLVELEDGTLVPGHRGLRFCVLMEGAERCGVDKFTEWQFGRYTRTGPPTCRRCMECVLRLRATWLGTWSEHDGEGGYFATIKRWLEEGMPVPRYARGLLGERVWPGRVVQHRSARVRGGLGSEFPAACNTLFQGLVADAEKWAVRQISRECYDRTARVRTSESPGQEASAYEGGPSPLYGSHFIALMHDEPICEHPEGEAHDAATRVAELQVEAMRLYCPDMGPACKAEPALMRVLAKGAGSVRDENGRLVCWVPKETRA